MRPLILLFLATICLLPAAQNIAPKFDKYSGEVDYEVWMPNADEPIRYNVSILEESAPSDTLSPCSYLIISSPRDKADKENNFSAYFDGNFFRYRGNRLTEWHYSSNPIPFIGGAPRSEMFTSLLPAFISEDLEKMYSDTTFKYTVEDYGEKKVVRGNHTRMGYVLRQFEYHFSNDNRPLYYEITNNPGEPTEQVVTANYTYPGQLDTVQLSEEGLKHLFPEVFNMFREDNFTISSLIGKPMPTFSLPTTKEERISHIRGNGFNSPTLIIVLNEDDSDLLNKMREVSSGLDIIYAFAGNRADIISEIIGNPLENETIAFNAGSLIRDCGIKELPAVIYCDLQGNIDKVITGTNNNIEDFVLNLNK